MQTRFFRRNGQRSYAVLLAGVLLPGCRLCAQVGGKPATVVAASTEKVLEPNHIVELAPGEHFALGVPLRVSSTVNLRSAELRIVLARDAKHDEASDDVVLIARLASAQALLAKGEQTLLLHGALPDDPKAGHGDYHASDYTIHLGSGSGLNTGTPDEQLIDTKALTESLSGLHLRLSGRANDVP